MSCRADVPVSLVMVGYLNRTGTPCSTLENQTLCHRPRRGDLLKNRTDRRWVSGQGVRDGELHTIYSRILRLSPRSFVPLGGFGTTGDGHIRWWVSTGTRDGAVRVCVSVSRPLRLDSGSRNVLFHQKKSSSVRCRNVIVTFDVR